MEHNRRNSPQSKFEFFFRDNLENEILAEIVEIAVRDVRGDSTVNSRAGCDILHEA